MALNGSRLKSLTSCLISKGFGISSSAIGDHSGFTLALRDGINTPIETQIKERCIIHFLHTLQYHCALSEISPERDTVASEKLCQNISKMSYLQRSLLSRYHPST